MWFKAKKKKIGIIGYGNMGSAIAERLKTHYTVFVFDKEKNKTGNLEKICVSENIAELVTGVDIVILAVKPQDFDPVLNEIKELIENKLVISIAAGITTSYIEKILGNVRVIRVMPNLPARVGKGTSCLCKGRKAMDKDMKLALKLFGYLGVTFRLNEDMMNAATAVSGSGPGFWGYQVKNTPKKDWEKFNEEKFIPELTSAAVSVKFDKRLAYSLAVATTGGTFDVALVWNMKPEELIKQVASKGGTTEAGLEVLEKGGSLTEAVKAAVNRAKELSKS